jgi:hypothetical protein
MSAKAVTSVLTLDGGEALQMAEMRTLDDVRDL